ncbi:MAG: hypothetical protein M1269_07095 [Chloroflexi bacterium]|nr:hypothetical protein [Chloroflexota bacterium]
MNDKKSGFLTVIIFLFLSIPLPFGLSTPENIWGINPGQNAAEALNKLGEPSETRYEDDYDVYIYRDRFGFDSVCIVKIGRDYTVSSIAVKGEDPEVRTIKGIGLGDSSRKVKRLYGTPDESGDTEINGEAAFYYLYELKNVAGRMRLVFIFNNFTKKVNMMVLEKEVHKSRI